MILRYPFFILLFFSLLFNACYSFKNVSIPIEVKTFYVENFTNKASNVVPTLAVDFTETLKNKIRNESRLLFNEIDPHVTFSGYISRYSITAVAPEQGETTAFNRLTISVNVEYENIFDEESNFKREFEFFEDYESTENILAIQDNLIRNINGQIVDDIFNAAFNNW